MPTILIIEDNPEDQKFMTDILESEGYKIVAAGMGPEGIRLCREHQPDLIILDLVMPEMNGIEALREFKKEFPTVPVIMCSAAGLEQVVALALRVGATGYIVKPYDRETVIKNLSGHIPAGKVHTS
jgi:two-component system, chemotaxis family, chemotaxis protein CheY